MLQGPGENAGVLDLGDGLAVTFKAESHNHPSAVEPFQGAATGVGGILRDIIAMGARPIALLDGLRFGAPDDHFSRAVGGIGAYGNSVGVPNVGGEVVFDDVYASNCLVNAMCVGLLPSDSVMSARADTAGALLVLYGATTGRDGIGGASVLASQELGEEAADKRPSVQVGDPFTGKRLIEVSVELVERGLVLSLQDCGAAGLASSLSEMAADYGIDVHLDRVPQREEDMEPWEIMISESQERMVAIVAPERLAEVEAVIDRWELHRAVIGEVTETGELRSLWHDEVAGTIPARFLTEDCPRYAVEREPREPSAEVPLPPLPPTPRRAARAARLGCAPLPRVRHAPLRPARPVPHRSPARVSMPRCCACDRPTAGLRSRSTARDASARSTRSPGALPRSSRRRATSPARAASRSASPTASTSATPRSPRSAGSSPSRSRGWRRRARRSRCRSSPATSRSTTTPTAARSIRRRSWAASGSSPTSAASPVPGSAGDVIMLASAGTPAFAGSELQAQYGTVSGTPPTLDLAAEAELIAFVTAAAPRCSLAHDVSDGGLAIALAEAALHSGVGARLDLPDDPRTLFGEGCGQVILALPAEQVETDPLGSDVSVRRIGEVGGDEILGVSLDDLRAVWERER